MMFADACVVFSLNRQAVTSQSFVSKISSYEESKHGCYCKAMSYSFQNTQQ